MLVCCNIVIQRLAGLVKLGTISTVSILCSVDDPVTACPPSAVSSFYEPMILATVTAGGGQAVPGTAQQLGVKSCACRSCDNLNLSTTVLQWYLGTMPAHVLLNICIFCLLIEAIIANLKGRCQKVVINLFCWIKGKSLERNQLKNDGAK